MEILYAVLIIIYVLFATLMALWAVLFYTYPTIQKAKETEYIPKLKEYVTYFLSFIVSVLIAPIVAVDLYKETRKRK